MIIGFGGACVRLNLTLTRKYRITIYNHKRMAKLVSHLLERSSTALLALACLLATSCATLPSDGPVLATLPAIDPLQGVTVTARSDFNASPIQYYHLLHIDGQRVAYFEADETHSVTIAPGDHKIYLTCYIDNTTLDSQAPINYARPDGRTSLDITAEAGDALCFRITYNPLNCAIIRESGPSYCAGS